MSLTEFTTVELQRVARAVLRRYLEVQTGALPLSALAGYLSSSAAREPSTRAGERSRRGRPRHADLGPISILRLGPQRAYATAAMQRAGREAPVALSVELEARGDVIAAVRVGETDARDLSGGERGTDPPVVGPRQPVPAPPLHLAGLLGGIPQDAGARADWIAAAAVIDTYRERYGIDDAGSAFGPAPDEAEQREERQRGLEYVRQVSRRVEELEPAAERDLGRGPGRGRDDLGR